MKRETQKYKTMKVFNCQDMPKDVRKIFFETAGSPSFSGSNDCCVEYYCFLERKPISGPENPYGPSVNFTYSTYNGGEILYDKTERKMRYIIERGDYIVSDWLFDNGAKLWEEVIIKHWW